MTASEPSRFPHLLNDDATFLGDDEINFNAHFNSDTYHEGDCKIARQIYPDPLSLVPDSVNLQAVLDAKTIGEAMVLLAPNLPGLPCKIRGAYSLTPIFVTFRTTHLLTLTSLSLV
jgi:hypothetical protein